MLEWNKVELGENDKIIAKLENGDVEIRVWINNSGEVVVNKYSMEGCSRLNIKPHASNEIHIS